MIDKTHLFLFGVQIGLIVYSLWLGWCTHKFDMKLHDAIREIYEQAMKDKQRYDTMRVFVDTTFCACESCKNRECPRKLTRLTIADAVRMGVPVRVNNFMNDCSDYIDFEKEPEL